MLKEKELQSITQALVLRAIRLDPGISRVQIARQLGLDKSTVTYIVSHLLSKNIVKESSEGQASPQGGRKPVSLEIHKDYGYVIGLEIQPDNFTAVAVNLIGEILHVKKERRSTDSSNLVEALCEITEKTREELKVHSLPLVGIGVGITGIVDHLRGEIIRSIPLGIKTGFPLLAAVEEQIDVPVFFENDANCCAWGELAFHRSRDLRNFIFVLGEFRDNGGPAAPYGGIAVGMGIVINGTVYHGEDFSAGEFKSIFWAPPNKGQFSLTDEEAAHVRQEQTLFRRFVRELSSNISLLVNAFNIGSVFLGGDIENHHAEVLPVLREEILRLCPYPEVTDFSARVSTFGENAVAYGAAGMLLERVFSIPHPGEIPRLSRGKRGRDLRSQPSS